MIFSIGVIKTIRKINEIYDKKLLKGNGNMNSKIKIIIADDDKGACDLLEKFLRNYDDIEILGIANTDKKEINMIENLKPEIVITDLMRNHKYTGLDIIRNYFIKNKSLQFLVISADDKKEVINNGLEVAGYIKKPFSDYEQIYIELKRIKRELEEREYIEWDEKYHNEEIVQVKKLLNWKDKRILKRLGISVKNKKIYRV